MKFFQRFMKPESLDQAAETLHAMGIDLKMEPVVGREAVICGVESLTRAALDPQRRVFSLEVPGMGRALLVLSSEMGNAPD